MWESIFIMNRFWQKLCQISIFKISKINFIRFKILLHLLHQLHRTQLRHRNLRRQLSIFAFLNCTWTAPTAPTAPNSTEIQKSSTSDEYFVFFELHQTKKNTKIVKIFSAPMNLFLFFIFNYELDIFYPFFKNDKIAF